MQRLTVEVWSDIACPWCWVGKRHLDQAIKEFEHDVHVVWRAFELDPQAKPVADGEVDYVQRLADKYGRSRIEAQKMIDQMTQRGEQSGIAFRFDRIQPTNTFRAHRMLHWAAQHNLQHVTKERLMFAYFNEGKQMDDVETLIDVARQVGLDTQQCRDIVTTDTHEREVRLEEATAQQIGVTGVPFFVFAGKYGVSGAQPTEALLAAMTRAWNESVDELPPASEPEQVCGPAGCVLPVAV